MAFLNFLEIVYPIGSIYISTVNTSPAMIVGGTWQRVENAVLRSGEEMGYVGEDEHTLTVAEIPAHSHGIKTEVNGTKKLIYSNVVSTAGYNWTNVFLGDDKLTVRKTIPHSQDGTNWTGGNESHSIVQRSFNCFIWYRIT